MFRRIAGVLALSLAAQLLVAGIGTAAPAPAAEMDVQVWAGAQPGQAVVIVGTTVPDNTSLPTTVRLPIVAGTTVDWAGEIGNSSGQDAQRDFVLEEGTGGQYAEFEVSESRQAQIELSGIPLTTTGEGYSASVRWVQTVPAGVTMFSVRLPAGVSEVSLDPAPTSEPQRNEAGETLYTLPSKELAEGAEQLVSLSYTTGTSGSSGAGADSDASTIVGVLLALLAVLVVVLALVLAKRRRVEP